MMLNNKDEPLAIAKSIYAIGSGKGGVGKSTIAVNLAVAIAKMGLKVGLLDADVYGPSVPIMMGLRRLSPRLTEDSGSREKIVPMTKFGVKVISLGFFMEEEDSILWRGPMMHGTLEKMLKNVEWGDLDFLFIDLPPGTGDVPISLSKLLHIKGAIAVSTPQEVAILDAMKAIHAFQELHIPLVGVVENMSGFTPPGSDETYPIFGEGKAKELAEKHRVRLLASIPLSIGIRQGGDEGIPSALRADSCFQELAEQFLEEHSQAWRK